MMAMKEVAVIVAFTMLSLALTVLFGISNSVIIRDGDSNETEKLNTRILVYSTTTCDGLRSPTIPEKQVVNGG